MGVDCHSRFYQAALYVLKDGALRLHEWRIDANYGALLDGKSEILATLAREGVNVGRDDLRYVCESTAHYHMPLCLAWRGKPSVINPSDTGHARRKTDRLDAKKMAHHSLTGLWRETWMAPAWVQEIRVGTVQRARLVSERARLTNRINGDMLRFGHTVGQLGPINGKLVRPLIEDFVKHELVHAFPDHFIPFGLPPLVARVITDRFRRVDEITKEILDVEAKTVAAIDAREWPIGGGELIRGARLRALLQTVPGVGPWTSAVWLAEVGDVTRFDCVTKVCAYAGLDASLGVSAGKVTTKFTRKGNARLHGALKNAARGALSQSGQSSLVGWARSYMARQKKAPKSRALTGLARRICRALYYVHMKGQAYDDSYYRAVLNESSLPQCSVDEMGLPERVVRALKSNNLLTSRQVVDAFFTNLSRTPGCGPRTVQTVGEWIDNQSRKKPGPPSPCPTDAGPSSEGCG